MIERIPDYYEKFKCIGGDCEDNCCIGWEIDVDGNTALKYGKVGGELGKRLKMNIKDGCFVLDENERCPFLNRENLCEIIIGMGEHGLCDICREHPRFHSWYDGEIETGLGMCCETACKIMLEREEKDSLIEREIESENDFEPYDKNEYERLIKMRDKLFAITQDRTISINERLELIEKIYDLNNCFTTDELIRLYLTLDIENINWREMLCDMLKKADYIDSFKKLYDEKYSDIVYEHILWYHIFRYFLRSIFKDDERETVAYIVFAVRLIKLVDIYSCFVNEKNFTADARIRNAKNYSKEIEYSDENEKLIKDFIN